MGAGFYVYELLDPLDGTVFYVGKGTRDRVSHHERDAKRNAPGAKCDRIREILARGARPQSSIIKHFANEQAAYDAEALLVASHGLYNLTNILPGGGAARQLDPVSVARAAVLQSWRVIRRIFAAHYAGISVKFETFDFVETGYRIALNLREQAGADYFDKHVRGCK